MSAPPTEAEWQRLVIAHARVFGWRVLVPATAASDTGWPDLMLLRDGEVLWLELKAEDGSLASCQRLCHDSLGAADQRVLTARPRDVGSVVSALAARDPSRKPRRRPLHWERRDAASDVLGVVLEATGVTADEVRGSRRAADVVSARWIAMWLLRQTGLSYPAIGAALGKDHSSVMHAVKRVDDVPALLARASSLLPLLDESSTVSTVPTVAR